MTIRALLAAALILLSAVPAYADRATYNRLNREGRAIGRSMDRLNRPRVDETPQQRLPPGFQRAERRDLPSAVERMGWGDRLEVTEVFQRGFDQLSRIMAEPNLTDAERAELLSRMAARLGKFFEEVTAPFADADELSRTWEHLRRREGYSIVGAMVQAVGDRFLRLGRGLGRDVLRIPFTLPLGRDWQRARAATEMSRTLTNAIDDELDRRVGVAPEARAWHRIRYLQNRDNPIPADAGFLNRFIVQHPLRYLSAVASWIGDRLWYSPRTLGRTVQGVASAAVGTTLWFWNLVPLYKDRETGAIRFGYNAAAQQAVETETRRRVQATPQNLLPAAYRMVFERMLASEPFRWGPGNQALKHSYLGLAVFLFLNPVELVLERTTYSPLFFGVLEAAAVLAQRRVRTIDAGMESFYEVDAMLDRIRSHPAREELWNNCGSLMEVPPDDPNVPEGS